MIRNRIAKRPRKGFFVYHHFTTPCCDLTPCHNPTSRHDFPRPFKPKTFTKFLHPDHLLFLFLVIIFTSTTALPLLIMAPRRSICTSQASRPYSPPPPAARRSQHPSWPSNQARLATASSQTETESTQEIPETPNVPETSISESTELVNLRAQRDNVRRLRIEAEMASIRRQINADLTATQATQSSGPFTQTDSQTRQADSELETQPSQTRVIAESMDKILLPLRTEYPMISQTYLRQIAENKFDPINLSKLCTDVVLAKTATKTISLAKGIEIQTGEEDASVTELKGLPHLIRCLGVYWQIRLHLAPSSLRHSLCRAFSIYQDRLLWLYPMHT